MGFEVVDGYLLGDPVSKPAVVAAFLADRSESEAAAPFYRALEAVGARAADEAFIALRLVLAGHAADDEAVKRLRAVANFARAARTGDRRTLASLRARERANLGELATEEDETALVDKARSAYFREIAS
jgi:hypothetical protein